MAYYLTTISHSTTGVKTRTPGFQPIGARITVAAKSGGETYAHKSIGITDGTNQICDSFFQDATRGKSDRYTDRLISQWEWNGAAFVEKVRVDFDSFTATEFKYNVVTADVNYQLLVEVWG